MSAVRQAAAIFAKDKALRHARRIIAGELAVVPQCNCFIVNGRADVESLDPIARRAVDRLRRCLGEIDRALVTKGNANLV